MTRPTITARSNSGHYTSYAVADRSVVSPDRDGLSLSVWRHHGQEISRAVASHISSARDTKHRVVTPPEPLAHDLVEPGAEHLLERVADEEACSIVVTVADAADGLDERDGVGSVTHGGGDYIPCRGHELAA
jgi:hypothetical protein